MFSFFALLEIPCLRAAKFNQTQWRPDIWGVSDLNYIELKKDVIDELDGFLKLVCAQSVIAKGIPIKNAIYYPFIQVEN